MATIPITLDMTAHETVTVKSVDSSGTATLSIAVSKVTIKTTTSGTSNTTTGTPIPAIELKVGADGRVLSVNGTSFNGSPFTMFSGMGGNFTSAVLPDKAVSPGDKWFKDYDQANQMGSGSIHVTTKSTYLRDESGSAVVQTTSTAVIDMTLDMSKITAGQAVPGSAMLGSGLTLKGTTSSDVTTWIDKSAHRMVKSKSTGTTDATMTFNMQSGTSAIPGLTGPFTIKGTQTLDLNPA